jgi:hypothetical protein
MCGTCGCSLASVAVITREAAWRPGMHAGAGCVAVGLRRAALAPVSDRLRLTGQQRLHLGCLSRAVWILSCASRGWQTVQFAVALDREQTASRAHLQT